MAARLLSGMLVMHTAIPSGMDSRIIPSGPSEMFSLADTTLIPCFFKIWRVQLKQKKKWLRVYRTPSYKKPGRHFSRLRPEGRFFLLVFLGFWQQHELWDGTYTLDDLLDIVELIRIHRENETRAAEAVRE